jgi:hypothetical protein
MRLKFTISEMEGIGYLIWLDQDHLLSKIELRQVHPFTICAHGVPSHNEMSLLLCCSTPHRPQLGIFKVSLVGLATHPHLVYLDSLNS